MPTTKFKKGNKHAFREGHSPHNKGQKKFEGSTNPKILRNGTVTHTKIIKSKKRVSGLMKSAEKGATTSISINLRKRKQPSEVTKPDLKTPKIEK